MIGLTINNLTDKRVPGVGLIEYKILYSVKDYRAGWVKGWVAKVDHGFG